MYGLLIAAALLALSARVVALPSLQARDATRISASQLGSYLPYTQFARAAYCESTKINPWACGSTLLLGQFTTSVLFTRSTAEACEANKDFQPKFTGGDGNAIQFCTSTLRETSNVDHSLTARRSSQTMSAIGLLGGR